MIGSTKKVLKLLRLFTFQDPNLVQITPADASTAPNIGWSNGVSFTSSSCSELCSTTYDDFVEVAMQEPHSEHQLRIQLLKVVQGLVLSIGDAAVFHHNSGAVQMHHLQGKDHRNPTGQGFETAIGQGS